MVMSKELAPSRQFGRKSKGRALLSGLAGALAGLVLLLPAGCGPGPAAETPFKHVILFIGDGMSLASEVAASRYLYGKDRGLAWHAFPGRSFAATWNVTVYNRNARGGGRPPFSLDVFDPALGYDARKEGREPLIFMIPGGDDGGVTARPATESASAATALSTGFKTDDGNVAWLPGDPPGGRLATILEDFRREKGGSVGAVTTVPFNHATPAAFIAHNISRSNYYTGYRDYGGEGLADEIILSTKPEVVIGGGHPEASNPGCDTRRGYISANLMSRLRSSEDFVFVERRSGVDGDAALADGAGEALRRGNRLFGLFGGEDGSFETPVPRDTPGDPGFARATVENPSFRTSVIEALRVLRENPRGFFLIAEEGDIDWANHNNDFRRMIGAMFEIEEAARAVIAFVDEPGDEIDWTNTLIVVTADHATGFLRLDPRKRLGAGDLPLQLRRQDAGEKERRLAGLRKEEYVSPYIYPDGEISYGSGGHTNELVTLSVSGPASRFFLKYEGWWYPGPILDNTQINAALREALGLSPLGSGSAGADR
jgi:alkaline phosphatase